MTAKCQGCSVSRLRSDERIVIGSSGVSVVFLGGSQTLFSISDLYRSYYKSSDSQIWHVALEAFLMTPVVRGIISLFKKEVDRSLEIQLMRKRCLHDNEMYMHVGLLSLALRDLYLNIKSEEIRDSLAGYCKKFYSFDKRLIVPVMDIPHDKDIYACSDMAERIVRMSHQGELSGGVPLRPDAWISIVKPQVLPHQGDILTIVNGVLSILYTHMDVLLAKRSALKKHLPEVLRPTTQAKKVDYPWPRNVVQWVDELVAD